MAEMAEVVQVIVEPLEFREQYAKRPGPNRGFAAGGALDRLAISERMTRPFRRQRPARPRRPRHSASGPSKHVSMPRCLKKSLG